MHHGLLSANLVDELYARGVRRVCDLYGPSETTTYSTYAQRAAAGPETVGHPLANTWIYLLDRTLESVPEGVAGEVCIGGAGVARGYLNQPGLTAERFVPDPFTGPAGARMYRTGDLARYSQGGALQLLGRMDHQVKVRGFRIEPGEIEVILRRRPDVSDVVVLVREDVPGDRRLVAYGVSAGSSPPATDDLRAHLRASLPEVMVPSAWVWLSGLPRLSKALFR